MSRANEILRLFTEVRMSTPKEYLKGKFTSSDDHPTENDFEWDGDKSLTAIAPDIAKDIAKELKNQGFKFKIKGSVITDIK